MVDVKEIKNIKIAPFTLMSSSISAILAFISGIIIALAFGIIALFIPPQFAPLGSFLSALGLTMVIARPILVFLIGLSTVFLSILLYNALVPKVGGIKLALEGNTLESIPIVPFALILSIIGAIWAFILGLLITTALLPLTGAIGTAIPMIANATNMTTLTGARFGSLVAFGAVFFIIILPILVFILGFIGSALTAAFYNYIAVRAAKVQLNFETISNAWAKLTSVPILPAALSIGVVFAIFGFIRGLLLLIGLAARGDVVSGIVNLIISTIGLFILYFIIVAIGAWLYNWLAPRIGTIKLELT